MIITSLDELRSRIANKKQTIKTYEIHNYKKRFIY